MLATFFRSIKLVSGALLITSTLFFGGFAGQVVTQSQDRKAVLKTAYDNKKQEIADRKANIDKNLAETTLKYQNTTTQKKLLTEEIADRQNEIANVENQILATRKVIEDLNVQINTNQEQLAQVQTQIRSILVELQKQDRVTPLQTILTSKSLGDALNNLNSLSSLQDQAAMLSQKVLITQKELTTNQDLQKKFVIELESTKNLLNSKKSSLQTLLEQTQGDQSRYENLLKGLEQERREASKQLELANTDYLAEVKVILDEEAKAKAEEEARIRRIAEAQAQAARNNNTTNNPSSSGNILRGNGTTTYTGPTAPLAEDGCDFEVDGLKIGQGYFGPVTDGFVTQNFHCAHDGVDIANDLGTSLFAISAGLVIRKSDNVTCVGINCNGGFGNYLVIEHTLPSGQVVFALYAHMQNESNRSVGEKVSKGDVVGLMGCTGYTTPYPCGVHVHFMLLADTLDNGLSCLYGRVKCYNPRKYIDPIG